METQFDINRTGTGTKEWAEITENIQVGCANGCLYCYAAEKAARFKRRPWEDWTREELTKRALMPSYPAREGVLMFPSSHDITPYNIDAYIRVAKLMLEKGNQLLIVSKPRPACIERLCEELAPWKEQILFRFTITTLNQETQRYWEPGAPTPEERLLSLAYATQRGYRTSVSSEPLLGGFETAREIVFCAEHLVTDTLWIGKLNKGRLRVPAAAHGRLAAIEEEQTDDKIIKIYSELKDRPKIRWKDSVKEVLLRHGIVADSCS